MSPLSSGTAGTLATVACAVAVLALLVAVTAVVRLRSARRALDALAPSAERGDLLDVLDRMRDETASARRTAAAALDEARHSAAEAAAALRHVSVVRYDAFGDQGGRLSFSAAVLNDAGDGLVLTSINGRTETRTYAKGIAGARSEHGLSPEEEQAVQHAYRRVGARVGTG